MPSESYGQTVLFALPSYLIMLWGSYGLIRIGYKLYNINTEDESEFKTFKDDIKRAKDYLYKNKLITEN